MEELSKTKRCFSLATETNLTPLAIPRHLPPDAVRSSCEEGPPPPVDAAPQIPFDLPIRLSADGLFATRDGNVRALSGQAAGGHC